MARGPARPRNPLERFVPQKGPLSERQLRFISEYLIDLSATAACERAGLPKTSGAAMLQNRDVKAEILRRQQLSAERLQITQDRVATELARIAFSDIRNVVDWKTVRRKVKDPTDATGKRRMFVEEQLFSLKDAALLDPAAAASISEIKQTPHGLQLKFHDKKGALDSLGKHLGMFQEDATLNIKAQVRFIIEGAPGSEDRPAIEGKVVKRD